MFSNSFCLLLSLVMVQANRTQAVPPAKETKAQKLRRLLAEPMSLPKGIDPNTPLQDVIDFLSGRDEALTIVFDLQAFEAIGLHKPDQTAVQLPVMMEVKLGTVLRMLLASVRNEEGSGTFLIRDDHIVLTTTRHTDPRQWILRRELAPTVEAEFERVELKEALKTLADKTGISIVLDVREDALKPVTARLRNTHLDTAVSLLADMAGLKAVALEQAIYVTTKENANAILAERERAEAEAARRRKEDRARRQEENPFVIPK
jgi:hypothetical protein